MVKIWKSKFFSFKWLFFVLAVLFSLGVGNPISANTAGKMTTNSLYKNIQFLNGYADLLLQKKGVTRWSTQKLLDVEIELSHVYQMNLAALHELHRLERASQVTAIPIIAAIPVRYTRDDVDQVVRLMRTHLKDLCVAWDIVKKPQVTGLKSEVTTLDIFQATIELYRKLARLNGIEAISPNEVFAQMNRVVRDLQELLRIYSLRDDFCTDERREIRSAIFGFNLVGGSLQASPIGKTPTDVFRKCLSVRQKMSPIREKLGLKALRMPLIQQGFELRPVDVFIQTQMIIGDINLLKESLAVIYSAPMSLPVSGKQPGDVFLEACFVDYMLDRLLSVLV